MLFGDVGHSCSHTPQPTQPSSITLILPISSVIAAEPIGHFSTQIMHSWPCERTHRCSCQTAVPMSMSFRGVSTSAPLGQFFMQYKPSQTTQGISDGTMYGTPLPSTPEVSSLMAVAGQTLTQVPQRLHVSRKRRSSSAP